jgi:hypothetical protein
MHVAINKRRIGTEHVAANGQVELLFTKSGKILVYLQNWSVARAERPRIRRLQHELDSLLASTAFQRRYRRDQDSIAASKRTKEETRAYAEMRRLRTQFTDTSTAAITQNGVYNELSALRLGWINCDRFAYAKELITYQVQRPAPGTITNLVFTQVMGVMRAQDMNADFIAFGGAPKNELGTVVALRREKGITYLALREARISERPMSNLQFRPVTMAELRAALDRM